MPSSQWFEMKTTHFQHSFLLFYKFSLWWCGTIQKGESTCLKQILIKHRKEKVCVHYPIQRISKQIKQRLVHSIYKRKQRIKTKDSTVLVKGSQESEPDGKGRSTERKREHWKLREWCLFALLCHFMLPTSSRLSASVYMQVWQSCLHKAGCQSTCLPSLVVEAVREPSEGCGIAQPLVIPGGEGLEEQLHRLATIWSESTGFWRLMQRGSCGDIRDALS